jgi:hypothetical protein
MEEDTTHKYKNKERTKNNYPGLPFALPDAIFSLALSFFLLFPFLFIYALCHLFFIFYPLSTAQEITLSNASSLFTLPLLYLLQINISFSFIFIVRYCCSSWGLPSWPINIYFFSFMKSFALDIGDSQATHCSVTREGELEKRNKKAGVPRKRKEERTRKKEKKRGVDFEQGPTGRTLQTIFRNAFFLLSSSPRQSPFPRYILHNSQKTENPCEL